MVNLFRHEEMIRDRLLENSRSFLFTPSGIGVNRSVVSSLKRLHGRNLIIESKIIHPEWRRLLEADEVLADIMSPEKIALDMRLGRPIANYDNVVWNVTNYGEKSFEAIAKICNRATNVWIRRIDLALNKRKAFKDLTGKFEVLTFSFTSDPPYIVDVRPSQDFSRQLLNKLM